MILKKKPIIRSFLFLGIISLGITLHNSKYMTLEEKEEMFKYKEQGLFPKDMIQKKLEENEQQEIFNKSIEDKQKEIVKYLNSEEYKKRETIHMLRQKTNLNVVDYQEYTLKLSFYSALAQENSIYGDITATGEKLRDGFVANNIFPFGTMIYMESYGLKVNKDRGSHKYFNSVEQFDIFVPRIPGESDSQYSQRVHAMGRV